MAADERRIHARIPGSLEIELVDAKGVHKATLHNLSHGGAGILVSALPVAHDGAIALRVPTVAGETVEIAAEMKRVKAVERGFLCGLKFATGQASKLEAVDYLLAEIFDTRNPEDRRAHPRVSQRISVRCEMQDELVAMVENISLGGLAIMLDTNVSKGEELLLVLPGADGEDLLSLPCRVANLRRVPDTEPAQYLAGLEFSGLTPQHMTMLDAMLISMV